MNTIEKIYNILAPLETDDYQNRDGDYPESGVTDTIYVNKNEISFAFKNTSCSRAKNWIIKFLATYNLYVDDHDISAWQDGDYEDDWVAASVSLKHIRLLA